MTCKFLAILAIFSLAAVLTAQEREALYVAHRGEIYVLIDEDGDGIADQKGGSVWGEKGGPTTEFETLVESDGTLFAGSDSILWIMPNKDGNFYFEQRDNVVFPGLRTPRSIIPKGDRVWIGGNGPVVEAQIEGLSRSEEDEEEEWKLSIIPADQYQMRLGPQNCRQFAWHHPTQSLLCLGETFGPNPDPGIWVVPNTWAGLDWKNSQFMLMPYWQQGVEPIGLVSDRTGVYVMETASRERYASILVAKLTLQRSGTGSFRYDYQEIGRGRNDDAPVPQPLAIGKNGMYLVLASEVGHGNITYNIFRVSRDGVWSPFYLNLAERPTAILVRKY